MAKTLNLEDLYSRLRKENGHQHWWPGNTDDEIIIGAMLTQQASWKNVELAMDNLRRAGCLSLRKIDSMDLHDLEGCVKPSGFYRQKAARLKAFARHVYSSHGSLGRMLSGRAGTLRKELLELDGIGPETADSILLYAAGKPAFVIDAYTKRIMNRIYGLDKDIGYYELQEHITSRIRKDAGLYNDFHAQLVELGKNHCRTKPLCNMCPIIQYCRHGRKNAQR